MCRGSSLSLICWQHMMMIIIFVKRVHTHLAHIFWSVTYHNCTVVQFVFFAQWNSAYIRTHSSPSLVHAHLLTMQRIERHINLCIEMKLEALSSNVNLWWYWWSINYVNSTLISSFLHLDAWDDLIWGENYCINFKSLENLRCKHYY